LQVSASASPAADIGESHEPETDLIPHVFRREKINWFLAKAPRKVFESGVLPGCGGLTGWGWWWLTVWN